jgi:hypothetical protein
MIYAKGFGGGAKLTPLSKNADCQLEKTEKAGPRFLVFPGAPSCSPAALSWAQKQSSSRAFQVTSWVLDEDPRSLCQLKPALFE